MTAQHEEFEVGHELDRTVRAAVTGLAQMMERYARRSQDRSRETAARVREEWLTHRDAARRQWMPWTSPGRLEKLDSRTASQKWAAAAAWSGMDPAARMAEQEMAQRIMEKFGQHPSVLIHKTDPKSLQADPNPPAKLLSMNEAYTLAATHAPSWYSIPEEVKPLETDRPPAGEVEERFHADWQCFSESGVLPERSQWEQWANHVGRGEEFDPSRWLDGAGNLDEVARDDALAAVWAEGSETRVAGDLADHEAAMHAAGMGHLAQHIGDVSDGVPKEIVQDHSWNAFLTPARFDAATPEQITRAWRDASAAALTGDVGAKRSADRIAEMMRQRRGLNPESLLVEALTEQAAVTTEARRAAEDRARASEEALRHSTPAPASGDQVTRQPEATSTTAAGPAGASTTASAAAAVGGSATGAAGVGRTAGEAAEAISRERVIELNEMAADFYAKNLRPGTPGHRYFADRLGPEFESGPWTLGYARPGWQNLTNHLRSQGASDGEMVTAGLAEPGKFGVRDVFRDRAMMGIRDHETGELVGFLGRDLSGSAQAPKVRNTGETPAFRKGDHVFGLYEAQPGARLVRVEGPFDAMAVSLASGHKAAGVGPMGTQMTNTQAEAIARKANGRVWLANDNDAGGQKATEEDFFRFSDLGTDVRQVSIPGTDPAAAWKESPAFLQSALAELPQAPSAAETVVDRYLASPEANRRGFDELMGRIAPYVDPVDHQLLALRGEELDRARGRRADAEAVEGAARSRLDDARADLATSNGVTARAGMEPLPGESAEDYRQRTEAAPDEPAGERVTDAGEERGEWPADGPPEGSERGPAGQAELEERVAGAEDDLDRAHGETEAATAAEAKAYDRRDEARREGLPPDASTARDASSHGFSKSTQDQIQGAPQQRTGAKAKVQRGPAARRGTGRRLTR